MESRDKHTIIIDVAGFQTRLRTDDAHLASRLRERYADFLIGSDSAGDPSIAAQRPPLTIDLILVPDAEYIPIEPGPWIIESTYDEERLTYRSYIEQGEVDWRNNHGYLEMNPLAHVENFLRVVYAWVCLQEGGLLLHAAGVIRDGDGFVFFGPSGAGKTTTSTLSAPIAEILSDDLVIIREVDGVYRLFGVPFKGDISDAPRANQVAPLRGIFRLRQDQRHAVTPLPHTYAVAELVASSPFIVRDLTLSQQLISTCNQIVSAVPVNNLHFRKDNAFWKEIDGYYEGVPQAASANGRARN